MKNPFVLGLTSLLLAAPLSAQFSNESLERVSITARNAPQVAAYLEGDGFDVVEGSVTESTIELVVSPLSKVALMGLGFEPVVLEVGRPLRQKELEQYLAEHPNAPAQRMPPAGYPDLATVISTMSQAEASFPGIVDFVNLTARYGLPTTFGGRNLFAVKVSDNPTVDEDEPAVLVVGAHHCRETVTPVICLEALEQLTSGYGVDPEITALVDQNEIWIAPVWNPDGYNFVFTTNNLWRKNRRVFGNGVGVDLNRNYDFGWNSPCAGSTNVNSDTYKGPSAASEVETITMEVWSEDVRFTKVIDYHSFGRETLWEYGCDPHPLSSYLQNEAKLISQASGYGNANRPPSANGEHYEWQLAKYGNHAFLTETHTSFQPSYASALNEAQQVWGGIKHLIELGTPISGHVTDALTGLPISASISTRGLNYQRNETNTSDPQTGRYHAFYPPGNYIMTFSAPGYHDFCIAEQLGPGEAAVRDVQMMPSLACPPPSVTVRNGGANPNVYTATPVRVGQASTFTADTQGFGFATFYGVSCPQERIADFGFVLIDIDSAPVFVSGPHPGPVAQASFVVTNDPALCGTMVYSQAKIHNVAARPFAVTNGLDLLIGQ